MLLIDLSHTIEVGMPLFSPTAPQPKIYPWLSHTQAAQSGRYFDCTCEITEVRFLTSIGTYIDSPYHFHPNKDSVERLELQQCVLPGLVVDCTNSGKKQPISPLAIHDLDLSGKAILFHTGWSQYWEGTDYSEHPFLIRETAEELVKRGAKLVGIDCLMIDNPRNPERPVHVTLLDEDILIVENLTHLNNLPKSGFTFHAAPVKISGAASFPVRAYGLIN
jgi:kynurenine formamidase